MGSWKGGGEQAVGDLVPSDGEQSEKFESIFSEAPPCCEADFLFPCVLISVQKSTRLGIPHTSIHQEMSLMRM